MLYGELWMHSRDFPSDYSPSLAKSASLNSMHEVEDEGPSNTAVVADSKLILRVYSYSLLRVKSTQVRQR
jgi:hypothetical protein